MNSDHLHWSWLLCLERRAFNSASMCSFFQFIRRWRSVENGCLQEHPDPVHGPVTRSGLERRLSTTCPRTPVKVSKIAAVSALHSPTNSWTALSLQ